MALSSGSYMISIKILADLPEDLQKIKTRDLEQYEKSHGVCVNYRQFSLVLSDPSTHRPLGVLSAYTAFSEIYIDDIWVETTHRRKGYGKTLLQYLEQHFENKGFNNINLVTSQFQAPKFYQKCGYQLEFIRKNIPNPELNKYFFIKFFKNDHQTQGKID